MADQGRLGILISGTGSNMRALVQACERGEISADVRFVGSDNPAAPGLNWAQRRGLNTFVVDYKALARHDWRKIDLSRLPNCSLNDMLHYKPQRLFTELLLGDEIEQRGCDLLCLAGFMRLLTPFFVQRISPNPDQPCIMNIHPSLLPAFPGVDGYGDTYRYGCRVAGCTVHFVDSGLDSGPIIGQRSFDIDSMDSLEDIKRKGLLLEHQLYPECVRLFFAKRLAIRSLTQSGGVVRRMVQVFTDGGIQ